MKAPSLILVSSMISDPVPVYAWDSSWASTVDLAATVTLASKTTFAGYRLSKMTKYPISTFAPIWTPLARWKAVRSAELWANQAGRSRAEDRRRRNRRRCLAAVMRLPSSEGRDRRSRTRALRGIYDCEQARVREPRLPFQVRDVGQS